MLLEVASEEPGRLLVLLVPWQLAEVDEPAEWLELVLVVVVVAEVVLEPEVDG